MFPSILVTRITKHEKVANTIIHKDNYRSVTLDDRCLHLFLSQTISRVSQKYCSINQTAISILMLITSTTQTLKEWILSGPPKTNQKYCIYSMHCSILFKQCQCLDSMARDNVQNMALDNAVFRTPIIIYEWLELRCIVTLSICISSKYWTLARLSTNIKWNKFSHKWSYW